MRKRILSLLLVICMIAACLPVMAFAANSERAYDFDLNINGNYEIQANPGDVLTVNLTLRRTDVQEAADMYAMQDEIRYDNEFFEIVDGGTLVSKDVETTDLELQGGDHAFYMNFLSISGGESWESEVLVGSFQVKVLAESGSSVLKNENFVVSVQDGSDSYEVTARDVKVIVSTDCTVHFDSLGGTEIPDQTVPIGSKVQKPEDPERDGYTFRAWYTDTALTEEWDFDEDTVESNMTLYAGWDAGAALGAMQNHVETGGFPWWMIVCGILLLLILIFLLLFFGKKTVRFDTDGGSEVKSVRVHKGDKLERPETTELEGADFLGWYQDKERTKRWNFEEDTVEKSMTLYAKWRRG